MRRRVPIPAAVVAVVALAIVAATAGAQDNLVQIESESFGVGDCYRPGEFIGIAVTLTSGMSEPVSAWVQIEIPNVDGDIAEYGRAASLGPGIPKTVWLYAPLPPGFDSQTTYPVRVFEYDEGGRRRREIGGRRLGGGPGVLVQPSWSMIGVIGDNKMGLQAYQPSGRQLGRPLNAHEATLVVSSLRPTRLPDRWEGLKAFEAIAWGGGDRSPGDLLTDEGHALRDYVQRGGHLIISLPREGNPWGLGTEDDTNPLSDLLPPNAPRDVQTNLSTVLPVLSKLPAFALAADIELRIRYFMDLEDLRGVAAGAEGRPRIGNHYQPLLATPDGKVFVVQRTFGFGRITVIGLDLSDTTLPSIPGSLQADRFWNPILGRRADTPSADEMEGIRSSRRLATNTTTAHDLGGGRLFREMIEMSEQAGLGLLAALVLFIAYFIIAGHGGYLVLKQYGMVRHSWLAFAAAAALFTAIAWGVVSLIKPSTQKVKHVTFLDMVSTGDRPNDPSLQRAVSWFSAYIPGYRAPAIFINSADGQRDLLSTWIPPGDFTQPFPNPDRYRVDVGNEPADQQTYESGDAGSEYHRPARATATLLQANWLGGNPDWGGTIHPHPDDPPRITLGPDGREQLRGSIVHDLPGELRHVKVIWVRNLRPDPRRYTIVPDSDDPTRDVLHPWVVYGQSGRSLVNGNMWALASLPATGFMLDQLQVDGASNLASAIKKEYVDEYRTSSFAVATTGPRSIRSDDDRRNYMEMLGLFNQLTPPTYLMEPDGTVPESLAAYRLLGRELDLSPWFTGPCLIVIGYLEGADCPVPLLFDGRPPRYDEGSRVVVRWICPLNVMEEVAFRDYFEPEDEATGP